MPKRKQKSKSGNSSEEDDEELDVQQQAKITGLSSEELRLVLECRRKKAAERQAKAQADAQAQAQKEKDAAIALSRKKATIATSRKQLSARKEVHKVGSTRKEGEVDKGKDATLDTGADEDEGDNDEEEDEDEDEDDDDDDDNDRTRNTRQILNVRSRKRLMKTIQELQYHLEQECKGGPYSLTRPWKSGWTRKQRNQIIEYTRIWLAKKRKNPNATFSDTYDLLHNISKDNRTNHAKRKYKAACREAAKNGQAPPPKPKRGRPRKNPELTAKSKGAPNKRRKKDATSESEIEGSEDESEKSKTANPAPPHSTKEASHSRRPSTSRHSTSISQVGQEHGFTVHFPDDDFAEGHVCPHKVSMSLGRWHQWCREKSAIWRDAARMGSNLLYCSTSEYRGVEDTEFDVLMTLQALREAVRVGSINVYHATSEAIRDALSRGNCIMPGFENSASGHAAQSPTPEPHDNRPAHPHVPADAPAKPNTPISKATTIPQKPAASIPSTPHVPADALAKPNTPISKATTTPQKPAAIIPSTSHVPVDATAKPHTPLSKAATIPQKPTVNIPSTSHVPVNAPAKPDSHVSKATTILQKPADSIPSISHTSISPLDNVTAPGPIPVGHASLLVDKSGSSRFANTNRKEPAQQASTGAFKPIDLFKMSSKKSAFQQDAFADFSSKFAQARQQQLGQHPGPQHSTSVVRQALPFKKPSPQPTIINKTSRQPISTQHPREQVQPPSSPPKRPVAHVQDPISRPLFERNKYPSAEQHENQGSIRTNIGLEPSGAPPALPQSRHQNRKRASVAAPSHPPTGPPAQMQPPLPPLARPSDDRYTPGPKRFTYPKGGSIAQPQPEARMLEKDQHSPKRPPAQMQHQLPLYPPKDLQSSRRRHADGYTARPRGLPTFQPSSHHATRPLRQPEYPSSKAYPFPEPRAQGPYMQNKSILETMIAYNPVKQYESYQDATGSIIVKIGDTEYRDVGAPTAEQYLRQSPYATTAWDVISSFRRRKRRLEEEENERRVEKRLKEMNKTPPSNQQSRQAVVRIPTPTGVVLPQPFSSTRPQQPQHVIHLSSSPTANAIPAALRVATPPLLPSGPRHAPQPLSSRPPNPPDAPQHTPPRPQYAPQPAPSHPPYAPQPSTPPIPPTQQAAPASNVASVQKSAVAQPPSTGRKPKRNKAPVGPAVPPIRRMSTRIPQMEAIRTQRQLEEEERLRNEELQRLSRKRGKATGAGGRNPSINNSGKASAAVRRRTTQQLGSIVDFATEPKSPADSIRLF
ncbi:hypothetical protein BJ508DRAFT_336253 [Ascobolus immersus RN42]|uniref:Uncharacterized protein n=1 Tax=Ascobolus immersus RN42 TaxID=1160509 RepID=A0A3N4H968_ASCIM|nr:hypothetical protein BJ508DRAFT_336253 [Ascobolus immersus RN42]